MPLRNDIDDFISGINSDLEDQRDIAPLDTNSKPVEQYSIKHNMTSVAPPNISPSALDYSMSFDGGYDQDYMFGNSQLVSDKDIVGTAFYDSSAPKKKGRVSTPLPRVNDALEGAGETSIDATVGFGGRLLEQAGERILHDNEVARNSFVNFFMKEDFFSSLSPSINIQSLGRPTGFGIGISDKQAKRLITNGKRLQDRSDKWIVDNGFALQDGEESTFIRKLGAGATSLGAAVGLTVVFKSPAVAALYFGGLEQTDIYKESRAAGNDVNSSVFWADVGFVATAALENIGLNFLFKGFKKGPLVSGVIGSATEGLQETAQTGAGILVRESGEITNDTPEQIISKLWDAFAVGATLGGATGVAGGVISKREEVKDNAPTKPLGDTVEEVVGVDEVGGGLDQINAEASQTPPTDTTQAEVAEDTSSKILEEVNDSLKTESEILADADSEVPALAVSKKIKEGQPKVVEIAETFQNGEDLVSTVHKTEEQKAKTIEDGMEALRNDRAKTGQQAKKGRIKVLEDRESELVEELASLSEQGENAFKEFVERTKVSDEISELEETILNSEDREEAFMAAIVLEETGEGFTDKFDESSKVSSIKKKADKAREELSAIQGEIDSLVGLEGNEALTQIGKNRVEIRANILDKLHLGNVKALLKGIKIGERFQKAQRNAVKKVLNKVIDKLPKSVNDLKPKLKNRYSNVEKPEDIQKAIDGIMADTLAYMKRESKKELIKSVESLVRKNSFDSEKKAGDKKGMHYEMQDAIDRMSRVIGSPKKALKAYKKLMGQTTWTTADVLEAEFYILEATKANRVDTEQTWQSFKDNLESFINTGKTIWEKEFTARNKKVEDSNKLIWSMKKPEGGWIKSLTGMSAHDIANMISGETGWIASTYQTMVERSNLQDTIFGDHIKADAVYEKSGGEAAKDFSNAIKDIISWEFLDNSIITGAQIEITTNAKGFKNRKYIMTKREALQWYMWSKDKYLRDAMMDQVTGNGFTQEHIDKIEKFIGDEGLELADAMFKFMDRMHEKVNPHYRKAYGRSLKKNKSYSPVSKYGDDSETMSLDMIDKVDQTIGSSAFENRTKNNYALEQKDFIDNATNYVRSIEWFIAYNEFFNQANKLLKGDRTGKTKAKLIEIFGKKNYTTFKSHIELLKNDSSQWHTSQAAIIDKLVNNLATGQIGANPQIMLKQMTSSYASAAEIGEANWAIGVAKFMEDPKGNWKKMHEHPSFEFRGGGHQPELEVIRSNNTRPLYKNETYDKYKHVALKTVKFGDKVGLAVSSFAEYHHNLTNLGMSEEDAMNSAILNGQKTQQSNYASQKTMVQKQSNTFSKIATVFSSGGLALANADFRYARQHIDGKITKTEMMRKMAVIRLISLVFNYVSSGFNIEKEEALTSIMVGPMSSIPILGDLINFLAGGALDIGADIIGADKPVKPIVDRGIGANQLVELAKEAKGIYDTLDDALSEDEWPNSLEVLEGIASLADGLTGQPIRNVLDELVGFMYTIQGKEGGLRKAAGTSQFTIDQDIKNKNKSSDGNIPSVNYTGV